MITQSETMISAQSETMITHRRLSPHSHLRRPLGKIPSYTTPSSCQWKNYRRYRSPELQARYKVLLEAANMSCFRRRHFVISFPRKRSCTGVFIEPGLERKKNKWHLSSSRYECILLSDDIVKEASVIHYLEECHTAVTSHMWGICGFQQVAEGFCNRAIHVAMKILDANHGCQAM